MIAILTLCVTAIIASFTLYYNLMGEEASRKEYIDKLKARRPEKISKIYKNYLEKGLHKLEDWFGAPCSARALTFNTFFAIFYTISFFVISWVAGRSGKIGTIPILSDSLPAIGRILFVLLFVLALIILLKHKKIDSSVQRLLAKKIPPKVAPLAYRLLAAALIAGIALFSGNYVLLLSIAFALYSPTVAFTFAVAVAFEGAGVVVVTVAVAFAVVFAGASAGASAGAVTVAVTFAVTFAVAGVVAGASAVAFAGTFAATAAVIVVVAVAVTVTDAKKAFLWLYSYCVFIIFLLFVGLSFEVKFLELDSDVVSYLFFIVILPFINGFVDFVSFWVSRLLGRKILKDRTLKAFLWHFAIDFAAAVFLLGLLVFGICFGVELFNNLVVKKPDLMIDLPQLIEEAKKAPFGPGGLWITLMLFSTLVPTFAHFVIAFIGVYTIYLTPSIFRQKIADVLEENRSKRSQILPIFYFAMRPLFGILFAVGFWWLFGYAINKYIIHFADLLYKVANLGIELAHNVLT